MPCSDHPQKSNGKCSACLAADLLLWIHTLGSGVIPPKNTAHQVSALKKQYDALKLEESKTSQAELCRSLFTSLNSKLRASKLEPVFLGAADVALNPGAILPAHRALYRARIAQMGTWVGFTEFTVLARLYEVRFAIMVQNGALWSGIPIGLPADTAISAQALYFTGNHYEVCDSAPAHVGFRCSNVVATNPYGDCGLESFLLMLIKHNLHLNWGAVSQTEQALLRLLRHFGALWRNAGLGLISVDNPGYIECLATLRTILASQMTDAEVDDAIIAEGHLPLSESEQSSKPKTTKGEPVAVQLPSMALAGDALAMPWGLGFTTRSKRVGQTGYIAQGFTRIGQSKVHLFACNFSPSVAFWQSSIDFLAARKQISTLSYDHNLASEGVDKKVLSFIGDEGLELAAKPMHIGSVIVVVTVGKQQHFFACGGVNFHPGKGAGAGSTMSIFGKTGDNGMHSEKYCMEQICLLLQGFGVKLNRLLKEDIGDVQGGVGATKVTRVDVVFLNVAPMCDTCEGHWGRFRRALIDAGIAEVFGYCWWYAHDIKTWR
jgi:hypothetical protein